MLLWIVIVVVCWIALSYILATLAVVALDFEDILIGNLTDIRIIALAFLFGTITTLAVYFIDSHKIHSVDSSS